MKFPTVEAWECTTFVFLTVWVWNSFFGGKITWRSYFLTVWAWEIFRTFGFSPIPSSNLPINLPMTAPRWSTVAYIMAAVSPTCQLVKDHGTWNMPFCAILWHNFMLIHAVHYICCRMVKLVSLLKTIVPGTCHSVLYCKHRVISVMQCINLCNV